jgi:hypothetical protein
MAANPISGDEQGAERTIPEKLAFAWSVLDRLDGLATVTNNKTAAIVPLHAILLAVVGKAIEIEKTANSSLHGLTTSLSFICIGLSVTALISALIALYARFKPAKPSSFVFFGNVGASRAGRDGYHQKLSAATSDTLLQDVSNEIQNMSELLVSKFRSLNVAIWCSIVAVPIVAAILATLTW